MAYNPKILHQSFAFVLIASRIVQFVQCEYYLSSAPCGLIHSEVNLKGQNISFLDRDQTVSLHDDPRSQSGSWPTTKSIFIKNSCSMEICNETYFDGECRTLRSGQYSVSNLNMTDIVSVSCTCQKECKCEDIFMKKSSCARAYLEGGCRSCHALYIGLESTAGMDERYLPKYFPENYADRVQALRLRKGCTLTVSPGEDQESITIKSEIVENFKTKIETYECECDDRAFVPRKKPPRPKTYPPLINVPNTMDDIIKMLKDPRYSNHPGLRAAHQSRKSGRSSKNVYIMLLGSTGSGKSTTINLLFDNPNVTLTGDGMSTTTDIHEFRIPVPIDELGVANSELRVIDTPGLGDTRGVLQDAMYLATLDFYLASHEELKDRIPNVVLIFHKFHDNRFNGKGSAFVQMLRGLDSFRTKITDENYSNVIFVMTHYCSETNKIKRRPEKRLSEIKKVIEGFSLFPRPTILTVAENKPQEYDLTMVNGYAKLPNNEYYPRNLFEKLELVAEKGGDPIGLGVFRTAFRDSDNFNITSSTVKLLSNQNDKVTLYLGILTHAFVGVIETEISVLLKHVWDDKIDVKLKRKFPESLPYLQKALHLKNINTLKDVPKTSTAILELLTSIKHDEATRALIEHGLGIQTPVFPSDTIAGHSYNVFKDTYLPASPFVMGDVEESDIGFKIPKSLSVHLDPGNKEHFHIFSDKQEYIQHRLKSLGIEGDIPENRFTGRYKIGHNIESVVFKNNSCMLTATREVRLFKLELNDRPVLTEDFKNIVKNLPIFNESDHESVNIWNKFFDEYGTHVVSSIYGGGAIWIKLTSDKPYDAQLAQALFDLIKFAEEMSFLIIYDGKGNETGRGVIRRGIEHSLKFIGGDAAYHTTDLTKMSMEAAAKLLTNWKKSLKYQPSMLNTEMKLVPLAQVVKKLGQNYSSEIERAAYLLFNSSLKPKARIDNQLQQTGLSREQTPVLNVIMEQMAANSKMLQQLMSDMMKMDAERQKRIEEMEKERLKFEREQREKDRQYEINRQAFQGKLEQNRLQHERELADNQRREAIRREEREQEYRLEEKRLQEKANKRYMDLIYRLSEKEPPPDDDGGCLKYNAKILMADGSEKNVEDLKVGDLLLDLNFQETKVLGVNYQYLLNLPFHGFHNDSHFFTGDHMFVGPKARSTKTNFQFYVKSLPKLMENNPLMSYWDVKELDYEESVKLYKFDRITNSVLPSSATLFTDPESYPLDTKMYFIQVDSPTGTYFANGYACKVDVPPIEHWPNTMSLLFQLMRSAPYEKLSRRTYSLDTVYFMESATSNLTIDVMDYLRSAVIEENGNVSLMTLENANIDHCLNEIFNDPTSALISLRLYSKLGYLLSTKLDASHGPQDVGSVAKMQHALYHFISTQLEYYSKM